jgi:bifunctional enzyme CysN/CysC
MDGPTEKPQLNLVIVGHVDHGKSTLIGRLLYDTDSLPPSKMEEIRRASADLGHEVEFAYVMDHLEEERSQRITIDTAQTRFRTAGREYVIIDAPGHREFIRNMVTGASQADAAVFLVDAQEGVQEQTRRHGYVVGLLGIAQVVVLVNKMDLVDWRQGRFEEIAGELKGFFDRLGIRPRRWIPISARLGDNVAHRSAALSWYSGPTLLETLEELSLRAPADHLPLRLAVQDRYRLDGRDVLVGRVATGVIRTGQEVILVPSGLRARVGSVEMFLAKRTSAQAGESIGFTLEGPALEGTVERGEVVCPADAPAAVADRFGASVFWLAPAALEIAQPLRLRLATQQVACRIERIQRLVDSSTLQPLGDDAAGMACTQAGHVIIRTERPIALEPFGRTPELGRFVLMRGHDVEAGGIVSGVGA